MAFAKVGYGQVEPNHLAAMRTGQIYAQLPVQNALWGTILSGGLENGTFMKYMLASGYVGFSSASGAGEPMLVMNEVKTYGVGEYLKDFVLTSGAAVSGVVTPRLYKTFVGDIITTNQVDVGGTYAVTDTLIPSAVNGLLVEGNPTATDMVWKVVSVTTMPDGSPGLKLQRVQ